MENRAFKRKTIIQIIENKIDQWVKTIDKEDLRGKIKSSYILTGGAIASMLQGQQPNDFDIYFDDVEVCAEVAEYYTQKFTNKNSRINKIAVIKHPGVKIESGIHVDEFGSGYASLVTRTSGGRVEILIKSAGILGEDVKTENYSYFESVSDDTVQEEMNNFLGNTNAEFAKDQNKGKYKPVLITSNAISLSDSLQIITRFIGDAEYIHSNFDFVHATNYYSKKTGLVLIPAAIESIMTKELKYIGSLYPVASIFRMRKFLGRDWTINAGEIVKICWDISKLDMSNPSILQEQLTGVDVAYFHELLRLISKENRQLDRSYLIELINRIFD